MVSDALDAHVRDTDVFAWRMERDPLLRSTIVAVTLLDRAPEWAVLVDRVERATRLSPSFRQRLVPSPLPGGLASPLWVLDPDFDLSWHLRRIAVPGPGTLDQVLDLARIAGMTAFDPARPLWEATLVEGLEGGRSAMVLKVHHALTDGIGGVDLLAHVVDLERTPARLGALPPLPDGAAPDRGPGLVEALRLEAGRALGVLRSGLGVVPGALGAVLRHPVGAVDGALRTTWSVARFVAPITTTLSPVMVDRRLAWRYAVVDVPFAPLLDAAHAAGCTLNDAFVAGVTGGLRRYHERHGRGVERLRMTMPISVRGADDPIAGNRVTLVRFAVPVGEAAPVERMRQIDALCTRLRHERAVPHSDAIAGVLNVLPASVTGGMLKHVDVLSSNVPGFEGHVYVGGARVEGFWPLGPTIGAAANITLMSYAGRCCLGVTTDAGAVPDPEVFAACLREGFDEVLDVAGPHDPTEVRARSWGAAPSR